MNRQAFVQHALWNARNRPPDAERAAFERVALARGKPLSAWQDCNRGETADFSGFGSRARGSRVADVLDLRNDLRKFASELTTEATRLNDDLREGRAAPQMKGAFDELMLAAKAAQRAVESANSTIETHQEIGSARSPGSSYGSSERAEPGSIEVRSGRDYERHFAYKADDDERRGFDDGDLSIVTFLRGIARMKTTDAAMRALSIGTDASGGFSVPSVVMPEILDALTPASSLLSAGVPMVFVDEDGNGGKTYNWPALNAVPTAAWRAEAGAVSESDPTFRNVQATPRSLSFMFKVSRELLADGNGLRDALNRAIAAAFAKALDAAGLRGSGTPPTPTGILNTASIQTATNGTNGASLASSIKWSNLLSATTSILAADGFMPTAAIMAPRSLTGFGGLVDSTGQPLRLPPMLESLKMFSTSAVPINLTVGSSTDCTEVYVGDFGKCVRFVVRERPSIQLLSELYAATGQVGFACQMRADAVVSYPTALALITGVRP